MRKPTPPPNRKSWWGQYFGHEGESTSFSQYRVGPLVVSVGGRRGWFRLFGYGLMWKDTRKHRLLFSERNGYTGCQLLFFFIKALTPNA